MDSNPCIAQEPGGQKVFDGAARPSPDGETAADGERSGPTALDCLNAELAILDRPLEDDIEYYDDPPPTPRWRRLGATLGVFILLGGVTSFAVARWSSPANANEAGPSDPVAVAAPSTAPAIAAPEPSEPAVPASRAPHHKHHHHHHRHAFRR